jgi:hypothetical protein
MFLLPCCKGECSGGISSVVELSQTNKRLGCVETVCSHPHLLAPGHSSSQHTSSSSIPESLFQTTPAPTPFPSPPTLHSSHPQQVLRSRQPPPTASMSTPSTCRST